jgi:hypothetical protein
MPADHATPSPDPAGIVHLERRIHTQIQYAGCDTGFVAEVALDEVDRQPLTLLQEDARYAAVEARRSDRRLRQHRPQPARGPRGGGHRHRIHGTDSAGGGRPRLSCSSVRPASPTAAPSRSALELAEITEVTELMTGQRNLHAKAVGSEHDDITRMARQLDDLELNDEFLVRAEHERALDLNSIA